MATSFVSRLLSMKLYVNESSEDKDWDFEWRALTWLPAYSAEEECAGV